MNLLDVPLDELIKSKGTKRSTLVHKADEFRPSGRTRSRDAVNRRSPGGSSTIKNDPLAVPLDNLIAQKRRSIKSNSTEAAKMPRRGGIGKGGAAQTKTRKNSEAIGNEGRMEVEGRTGAPQMVLKRTLSKVRKGNKQRSYFKGLAGQARPNVDRNGMQNMGFLRSPVGRNLSINRRVASRVRNIRRVFPPSVQKQRRPFTSGGQSNGIARNTWASQLPVSSASRAFSGRSIAFQASRGTGVSWNVQPASHVSEMISYDTGMGQTSAAVYRQSTNELAPSSANVAPPSHDKSVLTTIPLAAEQVPSHICEIAHQPDHQKVFSENDRSMFSKIKIMAQLDKLPLIQQIQRPYSQINQSSHFQARDTHPAPDLPTGTTVSRYRTLSDRFVS